MIYKCWKLRSRFLRVMIRNDFKGDIYVEYVIVKVVNRLYVFRLLKCVRVMLEDMFKVYIFNVRLILKYVV